MTDNIHHELVEWADKFLEVAILNNISDSDNFCVQHESWKEPAFISIMGNAGITYGISVWESIEKIRTIPLNIRVKILSRDKFYCVFCGKSPATDIGCKLHVDHIIPFSKGGTNSLDNLQTLCQDCSDKNTQAGKVSRKG